MENTNCASNSTCSKMGCGEFFCVRKLVKTLLVLLILGFVFCSGVRLGELKGSMGMRGSSYGKHMMKSMDADDMKEMMAEKMMMQGAMSATKN